MIKKLLSLLLLSAPLFAGTYTDRLDLYRPDNSERNWGTLVNANFTIIDASVAVLGSSNTFTGEVTIDSGTIRILRADQVIISTANFSGTEKIVVNGTAKFFGPTGSVLSLCDSDGINCTNLSVNDSFTGINTSTMTFNLIRFDSRQQSVAIGNGAAAAYVGTGAGRPSVIVGNSALHNLASTVLINGASGGHTAVGSGAMGNLTYGNQNTAVGDFACAYITSGSYNTCLGYGSGHGEGGDNSVIVSTDGIFIGQYTGISSSSTHLTNAVAIGAYAKVNRSHSLVLGTYPGYSGGYEPFNVGIGTDTPRSALHVVSKDTNNYSLIVSSSGTSGQYHLAVTTMGAVAVSNSLTVAGSNVCRADGTNCPASGGGGASILAVTTGTSSGITGPAISSPTAILSVNRDQFSVTLQTNATAFIQLQSSSVTLQGNTFNAANRLVQLNGSGQYPALDGSLITGVSGSGGVSVYPATATASFPFGLSASTIAVVGAGAGQILLTEGLASTVTGIGTGNIGLWADSLTHQLKFIPNNVSTYTVVGTSDTPTAGTVPEWGTNGTLVSSDGSVVFSSHVVVGPKGTQNQNRNFIVSGHSLFSDDGTTTMTSTSTVDVFDRIASGQTGALLFRVGSDQLSSQLVVRDRTTTLLPSGAVLGSLTIGAASPNAYKIKNDQNTNEVSLWEAGNTHLHLRTSVSDAGAVIIAPSFSTAAFFSAGGGSVFRSSVSVTNAAGLGVDYGIKGGSITVNSGFLQLFSRTAAQLGAITPSVVGQMYYCSDCTALRTCISTGTAQGAFSSPVAATTACN